MDDFFYGLFTLALLGLLALVVYGIYAVVRRANDPYLNFFYQNFGIHEDFTVETLAGFKVQYHLSLICGRRNDDEFRKARMIEEQSRNEIIKEFNRQFVKQYLEDNNCFFHLHLHRTEALPGEIYEVFRTPICRLTEKDGEVFASEMPDTMLRHHLRDSVMETAGCHVELGDFRRKTLPTELIKENYDMLTNEDKQAVLADERYGRHEQILAVMALKRYLDFFGDGSIQEFKADCYAITVERAGRSLKLGWKLEGGTRKFSLLGFRSQSGFSPDKWSESSNGTLIVDATRDGEATQRLGDGSYYYTFVLKHFEAPQQRSALNKLLFIGEPDMKSPLRFQISIETESERRAIEEVIERLKTAPRDPEKENLSKALKGLGAYMEMDTALEAMERSFREQITKSNYSDEVKKEKIERLHDIVRQIRSKHEPPFA